MSSNHAIPAVSKKPRHNLTSKNSKALKSSKLNKGSSPIMQKLTSLFKRDNKESGHISVRPACFADSPERRRSESPEPISATSRRKNGPGTATIGGKKADATGVGWRPKVKSKILPL